MKIIKLQKLLLLCVVLTIVFVGCGKTESNKTDSMNTQSVKTQSVKAEKENPQSKKTKILVAAAASLSNVMDEIQKVYASKNKNVTVSFTFASSGALEQQIRQGAPVDLFISAAEKQMDSLSKDNLILPETKADLLKNELVLVVPKESTLGITDFKDILKASKIALGDPESVPAGQYAKEVFDNLKITDDVYKKATLAKDVTEVLSWVSSQSAEAGVVYATDALTNKEVKVVAIASEGSHSPITYPAAVIKTSKNASVTKDFLKFLKTKQASKIFKKYGFITRK